ncbi:esterase E4-like isoform X3 [Athalia rosae]|uniref:esterase E4-like isoform X3 n=1 Tax=Athalia rosae TaxID=37344 RepID=UPI00203434B7|nr:esterase E4-like isoform X3 [Athalia rosae]
MAALTDFDGRSYSRLILLLVICHGVCSCRTTPSENGETSSEENTWIPVTRIPQGVLRGTNMTTRHGRRIFAFKGIPYARPPVGNLRFRGPVPPDPWNGTFDASEESAPCPQLNGNDDVVGDEDCLHLNVYTPRLPANTNNATLLPVMLYIYGGQFKSGESSSSRWGPHFLLDKDVILVVPSYRIGVLGFLSTGDDVSPGNYGLKDMLRALEWNRENIRYFGGDPNVVTLVTGSSGSISAHILASTNLTDGLFHRLIADGGTSLTLTTVRPGKIYTKYATELGKYLGCPTDASSALVNCLRDLSVHRIVDSNNPFNIWREFPIIIWGPTVEPDGEGAVLTDMPANLIAANKFRDIPMISNVARDEGLLCAAGLYANRDMLRELLDNFEVLLPVVLHYDVLFDDTTEFTNIFRSHYLNDLRADESSLLANMTRMIGDALFVCPLSDVAEHFLIHSTSEHYVSSFQYRGRLSHSYIFSGGRTDDWGVAHGDQLIYIFARENVLYGPPDMEFSETDWKVVDNMVDLWTSFAITGTPFAVDSDSPVIWEPYSSRGNYLRIGDGPDPRMEVKYDFGKDRTRFCRDFEAGKANISWV